MGAAPIAVTPLQVLHKIALHAIDQSNSKETLLRGLQEIHKTPFWAACADQDVAVLRHSSSGCCMTQQLCSGR